MSLPILNITLKRKIKLFYKLKKYFNRIFFLRSMRVLTGSTSNPIKANKIYIQGEIELVKVEMCFSAV